MTNPLPPCRRVVTTHDDEGNAKVWLDEEVKRVSPPGFSDGVSFAVPWVTDTSPADCQTPIDGRTLKIGELTNEAGSVVRYVDMPPKHVSPMHRTISLDYGFVLFGELELSLPDGSKTLVKPGDVVVQRGTDHAWINPSETEWARMVYVLLPSKPIVVDGKELPAKSIHS
ncbi:cupin domain-containing protein [Rhodotorula paludigena]|uniref:cupin domain-containing protein n=1 Tax=Rhodotorula paludigena TaxID=86838 RepID=UPI00316C8531